ncbi:MAG: hypothetical protein ABI624_25535, partial [Casimicrobiaceae bacterium]
GQFDDFETAGTVVEELLAQGLADEDMETYALNAPGQHARFPMGGDEDADRSATGGGNGAVAGAALGGAAGLALGAAAIPVVGPIAVAAGLAVGAYAGSFAGAVNAMGELSPRNEIPLRPAGVRVVAHVPTDEKRDRVIAAFRRHDARSIEEADGLWRDGTWVDFDPVSVPSWLEPPRP